MSNILFTILLISANSYAAVADMLRDSKSRKAKPKSSEVSTRDSLNLDSVQGAFDKSQLTENVADFYWQPNKVFKVKTRLHIRTLIYLPQDEKILFANVGDTMAFKHNLFDDVPHLIDIQPLYSGADSNLTVITESKRVYSFYLRSYEIDSNILPDFTIYVKAPPAGSGTQFANTPKKKDKILFSSVRKSTDFLKKLITNDNLSDRYRMYGDEDIAPAAVYDDGKFTYFDFRELKNRRLVDRLPVIFKVVDGMDKIVNTRMEKGFLIAESISAEGWTLINGKKTVCVKPKKEKAMSKKGKSKKDV